MMDNCKIVEDLLPSYCDNLTSPESTALVEAHIARCPCCAGTLVAMKNRQSDQEQEKSREEFRSALRFYESRHKQRILWIALACAILVIVFFVLQAVSMEMALASKGISLEHAELVTASVPHYDQDSEKNEYGQLIWTRNEKKQGVLAAVRKNALGFWYVDFVVTADSDNGYNPDSFIWTEEAWNTFSGDFKHRVVTHVVFVGDNAVKYIDFPQDELPEGSQAVVRQKQNHYMIHITVTMESGTTYVWNVREILDRHNFIPHTWEEE